MSNSRFSNNSLCGRGSRRGFLKLAKKSILKLVSHTAVAPASRRPFGIRVDLACYKCRLRVNKVRRLSGSSFCAWYFSSRRLLRPNISLRDVSSLEMASLPNLPAELLALEPRWSVLRTVRRVFVVSLDCRLEQ